MQTTTNPEAPASLYDLMRVALPEVDEDGVKVERFTVDRTGSTLSALQDRGRYVREGTYTRLIVDGVLWMSDTRAEQDDHYEAVREMRQRGGRVLVNGLGLGMVVGAALALPQVEHVDVVELDPRVARLIGPHYAGPRCAVHVGDAYEVAKRWAPGTRWTVAWHDIWAEVSEDNLPEMTRLKRSYGRRVEWQGCWVQDDLVRRRRQTAGAWWR